MGNCTLRSEIYLPPLLIVSAIYKVDDYDKCPKELGTWFLNCTIIIAILTLQYNHYQLLNDRAGAEGILGLSVLFYFIFNGIGTYKYIYLLFHDHSCFSSSVFTIFGINFGLYLFIVIAISIVICVEIKNSGYRRERVNETREEYFVVLEKILEDENFNVEEFIARNRDFIDSVELLEKDKEILKKYCLKKYTLRESSTNADTCAICVGDFEDNEEVIEHPICRHTYHWECLQPWLEIHRTCPHCRSGTRVNLIMYLDLINKEKREMKEMKELKPGDNNA